MLATDQTGEGDWTSHLADRIRRHPFWQLQLVHPNRLDYEEADVVDVPGLHSTKPPPIIVVPEDGTKYELIDGRHRASAAANNDKKLWAYMPKLV
jgi:hypothetical protein